MGDHLAEARAAYQRRDWRTACDAFRAASSDESLAAADLYAYANTFWWLGRLDEAMPVLGDAHRVLLAEGQPRTAALVALDTGYTFALRGEEAQASGWLARASRLLEHEGDCAERDYLLYCDAEEAVGGADLDRALALVGEIRSLGRRFDDPSLVALAALVEGRVRIVRCRRARSIAMAELSSTSPGSMPGLSEFVSRLSLRAGACARLA